MVNAGTDTTSGGSVISLPFGGGAVSGLGEKFSPDLFTGTGNFSVPLVVPPGRHGVQPQLSLGYSTGNGNGPFGLGWALSLPGVARKTSRGVPRYGVGKRPDTFVLSGAEDLVPVSGAHPGRVGYRPRTEGLFARIEHVQDASGDFWEVRSRDGMRTRYGTQLPPDATGDWRDPAVVGERGRIFAWRITETADTFGNRIRYTYLRDRGDEPGHSWDQPLIGRIEYADYGDPSAPSFLVAVDFEYEPRPDPFSDYRSGFEIRTSLRCRAIKVSTHAADGATRAVREYLFGYQEAPFNGASLLTRVEVAGIDEQAAQPREPMPPLTFGYTGFDPARRRFRPVTGPGLPPGGLGEPTMALVDLRGTGLPDVVELGAAQRYWSNRGHGGFDLPRPIDEAPPHSLGEPGVRFADADGDGRADLLVTAGVQAGYFPMTFAGGWSRRSFQPYPQLPSTGLDDPSVKLVDLDGDGLTDVLRSGTRLDCWFNDADPRLAWQRTAAQTGLDVDLADPHVRLADMTGDGLQDIVLLRNGSISYRPNLGHGRFGPPVQMRGAPRLPDGHDPRRVLLGDVDGDGVADLVHVDRGRVRVWGNRTGNSWTPQPVTITGTPDVVDTDSVQLADLHGTGMAGLLWSRAADGTGPAMRFLDLTGGHKPYLLDRMDNHLGAVTAVRYLPSTRFLLRDRADPATRWRTTLPFPVHVVAHVEVADEISSGRLTTEYRYHHGYWDGVEREFRGFGMVEQFDTETFHGGGVHYSPATLTRSWFHLGPVAAAEAGDWVELDLSHEYWPGDPQRLARPTEVDDLLRALPRPARRDALRALRGQLLRTELYALDGTDREDRPYAVTESISGVVEKFPTADQGRARIFFPFAVGRRTTQWERGADPMTQVSFTTGYDDYGLPTGELALAIPRGRDPWHPDPAAARPYLATVTSTEHARRDDKTRYLVDRVCRASSHEVLNDGRQSVFALRDAVLGGTAALRVIGHSRTYYDGEEFVGLPLTRLGEHGAAVRSESLAFTDAFLDGLFDPADPLAISPRPAYLDPGAVAWGPEYPEEFRTRLPDLAGYRHYTDTDVPGSPGGYYVVGARHRYDFHDPRRVPRGLPVASLDPFGAGSRLDYDGHDLLPARATDPAGLTVEAVNDPRTLQPREVSDANGNTSSVTYSPAGFVTAHFVRGKNGEGDAHLPGTTMTYDLTAFAERGQPVSVRTMRRVRHDGEEVIESVEYSDGFGRLLQTRAQAEDTLFGDPVFGGGAIPPDQGVPVGPTVGRTREPGADNVVVSGWQTYDNKGRVVEKYEPFFATGYDYAEPGEEQLGQKATVFYDPCGHAVRTVNPDGSEQLVVIGVPVDMADPDVYAPTPWETFTYDANDNAGRTHPDTAAAYRDHWDTPASVEFDALGRTVVAVARNAPEPFVTRSTYDIQGNLVAITDVLGRTAFGYRYDLAGRRWRMDSIDAGRHDTIPDAAGAPVEARDAKGALTLGAFDVLRRPIRVWARDDDAGRVTLRQRLVYGDEGDRAAAREHNLLGRPVEHYDEAGLVTVAEVDFKGNVLDTTRRVIADAPILAVFDGAPAHGWQVTPFQVDWQPRPGQTDADRAAELLEPDGYRTGSSFDALNRLVRQVLPRDADGRRRELRPEYNRAGGLDRVSLDGTVYVERLAYDAKGQRTLVAYGNGVLTRYAYDPHTFRLARLRTEHYTLDGSTYRPTGEVLQDYGYAYDLAGNILTIRDRTPGSGIPNTPDGVNALDRTFTYDPIYRLLTATGRECAAAPDGLPWLDLPRCTDVTRTRAYTETYRYDELGGMLRLAHQAGSSGFVRVFTMETGSNRLQRMQVGTTPFDYAFDATGNMRSEATSRHFEWNHADQMKAFRTQPDGAEPSVHAHYLYDAGGQRMKKLVRRQGGQTETTHYLGGIFEHHRWSAAGAGQNNHIHVMDDSARIALVRLGPAAPGDSGVPVQFHLADHLGSSAIIVDETGAITNREEFTPYGETSFGSYARKRYRFTGKERDEESGLGYHGARYYSPHLARWASVDPAGHGATGQGPSSPFVAFNNCPLGYVDRDGKEPERPPSGMWAWVKARSRTILTWLRLLFHPVDDPIDDPSKYRKYLPPGQGTPDRVADKLKESLESEETGAEARRRAKGAGSSGPNPEPPPPPDPPEKAGTSGESKAVEGSREGGGGSKGGGGGPRERWAGRGTGGGLWRRGVWAMTKALIESKAIQFASKLAPYIGVVTAKDEGSALFGVAMIYVCASNPVLGAVCTVGAIGLLGLALHDWLKGPTAVSPVLEFPPSTQPPRTQTARESAPPEPSPAVPTTLRMRSEPRPQTSTPRSKPELSVTKSRDD